MIPILHPMESRSHRGPGAACRAGALLLALQAACLLAAPAQDLPFDADFQKFAQADQANPPSPGEILFVGSSILRLWNDLPQAMAPLPVRNRAFGGSKTSDLLLRFDQLVLTYQPRILVYYCGSNDLKAGDPPERVFERFQAFSQRLQKSLPRTHLLFLSSNTSPDRAAYWDRVEKYNTLVRDYCARTPQHTFLDITPALRDPLGRPRLDLYQPDQLHLQPAAYEKLAELLKPILTRIWNENATHLKKAG